MNIKLHKVEIRKKYRELYELIANEQQYVDGVLNVLNDETKRWNDLYNYYADLNDVAGIINEAKRYFK